MTVKEYSFKSSSGLCDIKAWQWAPEGDVKAVIQMHHGMAEHSGRYKNFIKAFTDMGYAVFMHDMINHGKSNHDKSLLGYFGDKDGRKHLTADAKTLIDIAKGEYPDKKIIIAGIIVAIIPSHPHFLLSDAKASNELLPLFLPIAFSATIRA